MLKENINPVLGCGTLSCKSILVWMELVLGYSSTFVNRASQVAFYDNSLQVHVYTAWFASCA